VKLSVAIVCRNNAATIGRVLDSASGVIATLRAAGHQGQIVAVDSGSTDATLEMLAAHGARVVRTEWKGHIATKQMALEACSGEWIIHLDSDESLEPACAAALARFVLEPGRARGARVNRKVWYMGAWLNHVWQPEWRLRVVRGEDVRSGSARWGGFDPHDKLELVSAQADVVDLAGDVRHESFVNIADHLAKQVAHSRTAAQSLHARGQRGSYRRLLISPMGAFAKQLVFRSGWRDGWRGWAASASAGVGAAMKHAILIELSGKAREAINGPSRG
jgi:glycosyltransferase involved in cell wall biosynthesis